MPGKYRILDNGQDSNWQNALEKDEADLYKSLPKKEMDDIKLQADARFYKRRKASAKRPSNPTGKKSKGMVKKYK